MLVCVSDLHLPDAMHGEAVALMQKHHVTTVVLTASYSDETRREMFNPNISQICTDLAWSLIPQEIFSQSVVITDTTLLRKFPCETKALRNLSTNS